MPQLLIESSFSAAVSKVAANELPTCFRVRPATASHCFGSAYLARRSTLAGLPATTAPAGTFLVTTLPAPTVAPSPITIPQRIVAPEPMEAARLIVVGVQVQSASVC